jgi:hypothetical protein
MSQLAYETEDRGKIEEVLEPWGLRLVDILSKDVKTVLPMASTRAIVCAGAGATIVAFEGTDPLKLPNWITDFDARVNMTGTAQGYSIAAGAVWPTLKALIAGREAANGRVYLTGHSLGGALAALTAYQIMIESVAPVEAVYTFGMPRPGSRAFAADYNQRLGQRTYRLVHGEDLVPTVAPSVLDFHHVGRHLRCDRRAKFAILNLASSFSSPGSDKPDFVDGVSRELMSLLHAPVSNAVDLASRLRLVGALIMGYGGANMRTDPVGIAIELLPPRLRDHIQDRYIAAL